MLCLADAIHRLDKIEVNDFQILLIDVTFYLLKHVQKLVFN